MSKNSSKSAEKPKKDSPNSYSASIIGKPIRIGTIEVAQNDFPNSLNWGDAIKACADLGNGWRLPTTNEFDQLYENYLAGGDYKCIYWSNLSADAENGWMFNFCSDKQTFGHLEKQLKWVKLPIRAVRTF